MKSTSPVSSNRSMKINSWLQPRSLPSPRCAFSEIHKLPSGCPCSSGSARPAAPGVGVWCL
ncbi:rCG55809 [Rattus norvegicus]|uniref:RCG55809 n=1 Tax=Rattus norvegicus TaxID=10116 RepID=A6JM04_RAT|nr:rCG55809 [Rattus norvegicus]